MQTGGQAQLQSTSPAGGTSKASSVVLVPVRPPKPVSRGGHATPQDADRALELPSALMVAPQGAGLKLRSWADETDHGNSEKTDGKAGGARGSIGGGNNIGGGNIGGSQTVRGVTLRRMLGCYSKDVPPLTSLAAPLLTALREVKLPMAQGRSAGDSRNSVHTTLGTALSDGRKTRLTELCALLLRAARRSAEGYLGLLPSDQDDANAADGIDVASSLLSSDVPRPDSAIGCVLAVPADACEATRVSVKDAARLAGLLPLRIVNEVITALPC